MFSSFKKIFTFRCQKLLFFFIALRSNPTQKNTTALRDVLLFYYTTYLGMIPIS
jgi:hypothetical protein